MNQIIEKSLKYQFDLYINLIDNNKAFDFINHQYMFKLLKNQGIPIQFIKITKKTYNKIN